MFLLYRRMSPWPLYEDIFLTALIFNDANDCRPEIHDFDGQGLTVRPSRNAGHFIDPDRFLCYLPRTEYMNTRARAGHRATRISPPKAGARRKLFIVAIVSQKAMTKFIVSMTRLWGLLEIVNHI